MRAPVQMKRSRGGGNATASTTGAGGSGTPTPVRQGKKVRVRRRLVVAVAVVAVALAGAAAPALLASSARLHDSQELVTFAELNEQAVTLAHSLADERDDVTAYIAAGRPDGGEAAGTERRSARVDRQIKEIRATAPDELRSELDRIADARRAALSAESTALEAHTAYDEAAAGLRALAVDLAERTPPRAERGAHAAAELGTAVEQAAATRGLLVAALAVPRDPAPEPVYDPVSGLMVTPEDDGEPTANDKDRAKLSAAAQLARVREDAALADFRQDAPAAARDRLASTVTGPDVTAAKKYLARLTDEPGLSAADLESDRKKVADTLSARVEQMRSVESALAGARTASLERLRDDDVTALEIGVALAGICLLVAVAAVTGVARSLTRPLAVLRLGSARLAEDAAPLPEQPDRAPGEPAAGEAPVPGQGEPIRFTGRNDEFAQVVRNVNALHAQVAVLHERAFRLDRDRAHLIGQRESLAAERTALREELAGLRAPAAAPEAGAHTTFVSLALRTLGLVERQLAVIEGLEEREHDPDRLSTLFKLDHFATVMRRHSENLLVLAGAEHGVQHPGPVPLVDVVRASVSEIERYDRVRILSLPPHTHLAGFAADDLSHLLAELLENGTAFSPPDVHVEVSGWLMESGEVVLSVQDEGIGMTGERLDELNARLADPDPQLTPPATAPGPRPDGTAAEPRLGLGLYVVTRLAARLGVRVQLRAQERNGIAAVVVLPKKVLADAPAGAVAPPAATPPPSTAERAVTLPGSEAEANSNALRGRSAPAPAAAASDGPDTADGPDAADGSDATDGEPAAPPAPADPLVAAAEQAVRHAEAAGPAEESAPAARPDTAVPAPRSGDDFPLAAPGPMPGHAGVPDAGPDAPAEDAGATAPEDGPRLTDKGLPKRTPKISAPEAAPAAPGGAVDADALRRRLGGFRRGSEAGRRDAAAERTEDGPDHAVRTEDDSTGETAEEARS
ncbi:nitrate- and nitrite sensing domain-containing protein [Streptomyces sp. NPDC060194]|uniref:sensor histidine kinase n=1 Tax=Streptomyces sp. NPDC060194 TaxID=3347069 RepID=UPI0036460010